MGVIFKSLVPNALLSLGYEGFYHSSDPSELLNTNSARVASIGRQRRTILRLTRSIESRRLRLHSRVAR